MRLIDADKLEKRLDNEKWMDNYDRDFIVDVALDEAPTVDAVPVAHGEWIMDTDPDDGDCRCSNCRVCIDALHRRNHGVLNALGYKLHTFYKYCPNCGAKMDGERKNNA